MRAARAPRERARAPPNSSRRRSSSGVSSSGAGSSTVISTRALRPGERRRGWCERRGGGDGCRGLGLDDGGWRGGEGRGLGVEPRGQAAARRAAAGSRRIRAGRAEKLDRRRPAGRCSGPLSRRTLRTGCGSTSGASRSRSSSSMRCGCAPTGCTKRSRTRVTGAARCRNCTSSRLHAAATLAQELAQVVEQGLEHTPEPVGVGDLGFEVAPRGELSLRGIRRTRLLQRDPWHGRAWRAGPGRSDARNRRAAGAGIHPRCARPWCRASRRCVRASARTRAAATPAAQPARRGCARTRAAASADLPREPQRCERRRRDRKAHRGARGSGESPAAGAGTAAAHRRTAAGCRALRAARRRAARG